MDQVTMACGQCADVESIHIESSSLFVTRCGLIEGSRRGMNRYLIRKMLAAMQTTWRKKKCALVLPNGWVLKNPEPLLDAGADLLGDRLQPDFIILVHLRSDTPLTTEGDYSTLTLGMFSYTFPNPVLDIVEATTRRLRWNNYAEEDVYGV